MKILISVLIVLLLAGCVEDEQAVEEKEVEINGKTYRLIDSKKLPSVNPISVLMVPAGRNSEGFVYYHPYNSDASTTPLYFLHENGGFSQSSEGCVSELD